MSVRPVFPPTSRARHQSHHRPDSNQLGGVDHVLGAVCKVIDRMMIVVPAHNEEDDIRSCLESIQIARRRISVPSSIVVVADRCTDDTVPRALDVLRDGREDLVLVAEAGGAGAARQAGTDCALLEETGPLDSLWIAGTDADTRVDPDWLAVQLSYARTGVIGVAGIVRLASNEPISPAFERSYQVDADGTHGHVHGANIGFRADAYRAAGGWNPLASGEDHDLWGRLRRHGPVVSTTALSVTTSARLDGRAPDGFAADLAALAAADGTVA